MAVRRDHRIDANLSWAIGELFPGDSWQNQITPGRVEKAVALRAERQRRGSECALRDCLQVKDKADILMSDAASLAALGLNSRREAERLTRDIEKLRNHLAHAQELEAERTSLPLHGWPRSFTPSCVPKASSGSSRCAVRWPLPNPVQPEEIGRRSLGERAHSTARRLESHLIEALRFVLLYYAFDDGDGHGHRRGILHRLGKCRQAIERRPLLVLPEVRADHAFGAMEEGFFDMDREGQCGDFAMRAQGLAQCGIPHHFGRPADPQGFALAGLRAEVPSTARRLVPCSRRV